MFSDVVGNTQYRLLWDDRRVTPFRRPSYNSNGNSFDFQGRQLSTEDFNRRVVRWEHDGTMTVIAEFLRRQAAELAERPCAASRWKHLVHRSAVWRPACRGPSGRTGRLGQSTRPAQPAHWRAERRHDRWQESANCRTQCIAGIRAGTSTWRSPKTSSRIPAIHCVRQFALLATDHAGARRAKCRG